MDNVLTYKDKSLARCGNEIYYGNMSDKAFIRYTILEPTKPTENTIPTKTRIELIKNDTNEPIEKRISKTSEKSDFYEALDLGFVWLSRALAE